MGSHRAHIVLPQELMEEIDSVVGPRGRSAFLVETTQAFFYEEQPVWLDEDNPELAENTADWVQHLRKQSDTRIRQLDHQTSPHDFYS